MLEAPYKKAGWNLVMLTLSLQNQMSVFSSTCKKIKVLHDSWFFKSAGHSVWSQREKWSHPPLLCKNSSERILKSECYHFTKEFHVTLGRLDSNIPPYKHLCHLLPWMKPNFDDIKWLNLESSWTMSWQDNWLNFQWPLFFLLILIIFLLGEGFIH